MSAGKMILGAAIAMATGAVLGVLFAPDKGSTTRKKLSKQGVRSMGAVKNTAGEYVDAIEENIDTFKDTAIGLSDKVKGAIDVIAGNEPRKHARGRRVDFVR